MRKTHILLYCILVLLLCLLLIFPKLTIDAAKAGLLLWFNIIVPTLFPFMILSYILLHSPFIDVINKVFSPICYRVFGISGAGSYAIIMGLLSGYPMGAIVVADLACSKKISIDEGNFLLTFCNNPSPIFVIGYIATSLLQNKEVGYLFLLCIFLGNLLTAFLFSKGRKGIKKEPYKIRYDQKNHTIASFDDCISQASQVLIKVGGYIICFSILTAFLKAIPIHYTIYDYLISSLDLTIGISHLVSKSKDSYPFIAALCAFGSFSVLGQTGSVMKGSGLSLRKYFYAKLINGSFSYLIAIFLLKLF